MPKIILCHCTCVIVINVDTCNEHDTTLNHTKSMHVCFILEESWRKVEENVPQMVAHCHSVCPVSIMPTHDCKLAVTMNYCLNEVLFHIYMVYFVFKF